MKCFFFHVLSLIAYLGVPFKPGGFLDPESLVIHNYTKALVIMNILKPIRLNPIGFSKLLSSMFYAQIVRPQIDRNAIRSLEGTLFDARGIVHDKLDENTSQNLRFLSVRRYGKASHTLRDVR
ncbi:hypothetical protein AB4K20DRAFT_1806710 [Rhizopus microsporus]|uniref:Uncharacterized protein n=1 Tax=Rhizopus microsporus TaxID=58291 RepID=A0A1X0S927_RHIZD|nr:hypothetical protein BCV71DRAFT_289352 [Rhizopus microsporus]